MGKSIWDMLGDDVGGAANNIGSFLGNVGNNIGQGANQLFGSPTQPVQPQQPMQAPIQMGAPSAQPLNMGINPNSQAIITPPSPMVTAPQQPQDPFKGVKDFGKQIVSGAQQGAGLLGDVALEGRSLINQFGTAVNPFTDQSTKDTQSMNEVNDTSSLRDALHDIQDINGNNFVGTSDVDQAATRIANGKGTAQDVAAVAGKGLETGVDATSLVNPAEAAIKGLLEPTVLNGAKFLFKNAAVQGASSGAATGLETYGSTGDVTKALMAGGQSAAMAAGTQLLLGGIGLGVHGIKNAPDAIAHTQLMKTNPDYISTFEKAQTLDNTIKGGNAAGASDAVMKPLIDQQQELVAQLAASRKTFLQKGSVQIPGSDAQSKNLINNEVEAIIQQQHPKAAAREMAGDYSTLQEMPRLRTDQLIGILGKDGANAFPSRYKTTDVNARGIDSHAEDAGFDNPEQFIEAYKSHLAMRKDIRENGSEMNQLRKDPEIRAQAEKNLQSNDSYSGGHEEFKQLMHDKQDAIDHQTYQDRQAATDTPPEQDIQYTKINTRNGKNYKTAPFSQAREEYLNSPEYKSKKKAGEAVSVAKTQAAIAKAKFEAHDKLVKGMIKNKTVSDGVAIRNESIQIAYYAALNKLDGLAKDKDAKADILHAKYPDINLDGRQKARVRAQKLTIKDKNALDKAQTDYLNAPANSYTLDKETAAPLKAKESTVNTAQDKANNTEIREPVVAETKPTPYVSPFGKSVKEIEADNEKAMAKEAESQGISLEKYKQHLKDAADVPLSEARAARDAKLADEPSKENVFDNTPEPSAPKSEKEAFKEGETEAYSILHDGGSLEDAAAAYKEKTGVSDDEAMLHAKRIGDTGAGMENNVELLKKNPAYRQFNEQYAPKDLYTISSLVSGHRNIFQGIKTELSKLAQRMSDSDMASLHDIREKTVPEFMKDHEGQLDNPKLVEKYLTRSKQGLDQLAEYERVNGGASLYRQNRGAGLYTKDPEADLHSGGISSSTADSQFGTSHSRYYKNYADIEEKTGRVANNSNYHEDVLQNLNEASHFHNMEALRLLQDKYGEAISYGKQNGDSRQLNGVTDVFAPKKIADKWNALNKEDRTTGVLHIAKKTVQTAESGVVQATVMNPITHGANLVVQFIQAAGTLSKLGPLGLGKGLRSVMQLASDPAYLQQWVDHYMSHIGHIDFENSQPGWISKLTNGIIPGLAELNKGSLNAIDKIFRVSTYKEKVEAGMDPVQASKEVDDFFGNNKHFSDATTIVTFFLKFFKTTLVSLGKQVIHPIKYTGATQNLLLSAAALYGLNYATQQLTGNNYAYWRSPGNLGLIQETINGIIGIQKGDNGKALSQIVTNRINPLLSEAYAQSTGKDNFTGQDIGNTPAERLSHAMRSLFSPVAQETAVADNKKSLLEQGLSFGLGLHLPHVTGDVATTNPDLAALNTPGAKTGPDGDHMGVKGQQAYFQSTDEIRNSLPLARQKLYDQFNAKNTDANGNPIGANEKQARSNAAELLANPDILEAITKQKQRAAEISGQPTDPLFANKLSDGTVITPEMRLEYEKIESSPYKGDDYINQADPNKAWMTQLGKDRASYFATLQTNSTTPSQRVAPPTFTPAVQQAMDQATNLSGADKVNFIADHPELQDAYSAISKYTNDKRVAQGFTPFKDYPTAPPDVRAAMIAMNQVKIDSGSSSSWIKANPDEYNKVQDYMMQTSSYEAANNVGKAKFVGSDFNQSALKSMYSLGQYDISKVKMADGTSQYSLNPQAVSAARAAKYTGGGSSNRGISNGMVKALTRMQKRVRVRQVKLAPGFHSSSQRQTMHVTKSTPGKLRITSQKQTL